MASEKVRRNKKGGLINPKCEENLINLRDRTPEERQAIIQKGIETRRRNRERRMALQSCMKELLNMRVSSTKKKEVLRQFGFTDEEVTNRQLLMVALFQKGVTGDVNAIREIINMMDKLDMFEDTGKMQGNVLINLMPVGESYQMTPEQEQEIWDIENNSDWMDKENDTEGEW